MKSAKLVLNKDFRRAYGRGHSYVAPVLVSYIHKNNSGVIRFGITTGKKIGGAVQRNRARRVIAAALRECMGNIKCCGADIVFVARTRTVSSKSTDVAQVMQNHFRSDGIWSDTEQ